MSLNAFMRHLTDPAPAFRCVAYSPGMLMPLTHRLRRRATPSALRTLDAACPKVAARQLRGFYGLHDGADFYCFRRNCALRLFPIARDRGA